MYYYYLENIAVDWFNITFYTVVHYRRPYRRTGLMRLKRGEGLLVGFCHGPSLLVRGTEREVGLVQ